MADAQRRLRVMADANVLIAGILFPRWFYEFLRHALRGDFTLLLSEQAIREARKRMRMGTDQQVAALEGFLTDCSFELVLDPSHEQVIQNSGLLRDSTDIPIALAAINAGTDYLVTNDKDFTTPDQTTAILRQKLHPITVGRFLHEVMHWSSEELERIRKRNWSDL